MAHKPAEFVTVCCSMSMVSRVTINTGPGTRGPGT